MATFMRRFLSSAANAAPLTYSTRPLPGVNPAVNWSLAASGSALLPSPSQHTYRNARASQLPPIPSSPSAPAPTLTRVSRIKFRRILDALTAHAAGASHPLHVVDASVGSDYPTGAVGLRVVTTDPAAAAMARAMLEPVPLRDPLDAAYTAAPLVYIAPGLSAESAGAYGRWGLTEEAKGGFVAGHGREVVVGGKLSSVALAAAFWSSAMAHVEGIEAPIAILPSAVFSPATGVLLLGALPTLSAASTAYGPSTGGVVLGEGGVGRLLRRANPADEAVASSRSGGTPKTVAVLVPGTGAVKTYALEEERNVILALLATGSGLKAASSVARLATGSKILLLLGDSKRTSLDKWAVEGSAKIPKATKVTEGVVAELRTRAEATVGTAAVSALIEG